MSDYQDWLDDKIDATAVECQHCGDTTYFEFDFCHECGGDLSEDPDDE